VSAAGAVNRGNLATDDVDMALAYPDMRGRTIFFVRRSIE